jgi:Na+:H+ antiporter, NhaA family
MQATRTPIVKKLLTPFEEFFNAQALGGLLLTMAAATALIWANSPWSSQYFGLRDMEITLAAGPFNGHASIQHLINDGLMALFFFVVGLEIKRELLIGELTSARKAFLPVAAAVGGMVVPAAIFVAFNFGAPSISGWAIPMATDIAFALGILSLFGHRIPISAKVFLTSLAIIDDLGAVAVIAMFYSKGLDLTYLLSAVALLLVLIIFNRTGIQSTVLYVVFGIAVWFCFLGSGIHATVAGVLVAATIPVWSKIDPQKFSQISQIKLHLSMPIKKRPFTNCIRLLLRFNHR